MELRTTEGKINELLAIYEGIRVSSVLQPEQKALLLSPPTELTVAKNTHIDNENDLIQSLSMAEATLAELKSRVEKFRKRLYEIDPVTEKPRYGPKSRIRVSSVVHKSDFLSSQLSSSFPEQYQQQQIQIEEYKQQQLKLQEQRQEQRRQDHIKNEELRKQQQERENDEQLTTPSIMATSVDANIHPDGSIIITQDIDISEDGDVSLFQNWKEASPASLLFSELKQHFRLRQQEKQRQEALKVNAKLKEEEEKRRQYMEEEARQKAEKDQEAAEKAAEEMARTRRLHQQAEEARLRRRAQEEARKEAEREWLASIQKGAEGVKYYLDILLQRSKSSSQQPGGTNVDTINPDRIIALQSLCTLFDQIQKHPEEVNKRKIKLSNPNFHRDIGQHEGGIELLVAAGFRPTMLPADNDSGCESKREIGERQDQPEIAFLISKEPNLEHDMDGWMAWFDLNKATLETLQFELEKVTGSKRTRR